MTTQTQVLTSPRRSADVAAPAKEYTPFGIADLQCLSVGKQGASRPPLIGRQRELAQLRSAVARLGVGRNSAITVEGDTGAGKTMLLNELAFECRAAGIKVFHGAALPLEQAVPFAALSSCMGGHLTEQVADLRRSAGAPVGATAQIARNVAATLDRAAGEGPIALLLDDAQWADPMSMEVLTDLAAAGGVAPLLVVVATRQRLRVPGWAGMWLGRLDEGSTAELALLTAGGPVPPDRLALAEGIPRYVIALADALGKRGPRIPSGEQARGTAGDVHPLGDLGPELHEVLVRELDSLPDRARDVVEVVAVLGLSAAVEELAAVLAVSVDEALTAAGEAISSGVLQQHSDELTFRCRLLHQVVLLALPETVRIALRLQIDSARETRSWERHD
ncbi:AAA family ATPase [Kitasatospora indigofera]|uniref:AAA family ATPase n=2 Tax=Kitasatospora indigofera TaxID=67307 RepID=UPI003680DA44